MAVKTFAAIDIGSYELSMKIFEVSKKNGMRQIDHIRYSIDMGTESYTTGKLSFERVDELCMILHEFSDIMKTYQVTDYKAYGTSAIRESKNRAILTDQVRLRTGIASSGFWIISPLPYRGSSLMKLLKREPPLWTLVAAVSRFPCLIRIRWFPHRT